MWSNSIEMISRAAIKFPQAAYVGLQRSLQAEWQFIQRTTPDLSELLTPLEYKLENRFIPSLFNGIAVDRELSQLPIKWGGLAIPIPHLVSDSNLNDSLESCMHIMDALKELSGFSVLIHIRHLRVTTADQKRRKNLHNDGLLDEVLSHMSAFRKRQVLRSKSTGMWLSMPTLIAYGTVLSMLEFRDNLQMRYNIDPQDIPKLCDGCGENFSVRHAMKCKNGGLIIHRHDEVRNELIQLLQIAFLNSVIYSEPRILSSLKESKALKAQVLEDELIGMDRDPSVQQKDRGDILVRGFWSLGSECILDVSVTDTDCHSYENMTPEKVILQKEQKKKTKYLQKFLDINRSFTPFACSIDGLLGIEAKAFLKELARKLSSKWERDFIEVFNFVKARVSIALSKASHYCIRGSRLPASALGMRIRHWEDGSGLEQFIYLN